MAKIDTLISELAKTPRVPRKKNTLKMNEEDIRKAKAARQLGATYKAIGQALGVSDFTVWCAINSSRSYAAKGGQS